jgi:hypothetical protein
MRGNFEEELEALVTFARELGDAVILAEVLNLKAVAIREQSLKVAVYGERVSEHVSPVRSLHPPLKLVTKHWTSETDK